MKNDLVNRIPQMPDVLKLLESMGADIKGGTAKELADHVQSEIAKWAKVITDAGITLN